MQQSISGLFREPPTFLIIQAGRWRLNDITGLLGHTRLIGPVGLASMLGLVGLVGMGCQIGLIKCFFLAICSDPKVF